MQINWEDFFKMSKWSEEFVEQYKDTGTVKKLTKDIKDAWDKDKRQKEIDQAISEVIKGKWRKKG